MNQDYHSESNRESSPDNDFSKRSILSKIDKSVLKRYKLTITRFVPGSDPFPLNRTEQLLDRTIDDPSKISAYVHQSKTYPPQVPVFGPDIKVNQEFTRDRKVLLSGIMKKQAEPQRSRSRSQGHRPERRSSRSTEHKRSRNRERRSESKERSQRRSRSWSTSGKYRSRSRERRHSHDKRKSRGRSRHNRKSRSRSRSAGRRRKRSISPLQPGEYRPGHPDLALSVEERRNRRPRSSSPSGSTDRHKSSRSTVSSSEISRSARSSRSPNKRDRDHSRHASAMLMPTIDFGYYDGYNPMPMHPYRAQFPMMDPHFYYPRMYPPGMMMPRMPMGPMMHRMLRPRLSVYNQGNRPVEVKPVSVTSEEQSEGVVIEEARVKAGPTVTATSTEKHNEDDMNVTEKQNT